MDGDPDDAPLVGGSDSSPVVVDNPLPEEPVDDDHQGVAAHGGRVLAEKSVDVTAVHPGIRPDPDFAQADVVALRLAPQELDAVAAAAQFELYEADDGWCKIDAGKAR